ncbi:MAG: tetratricopeptide repeat protein [Erysipelotrichaceae bacterium]|nr:tetratricopeptide repeat protein [Erysipelotrichaceae bacterium]
MMINRTYQYTVNYVVAELKQLLKEDIPKEFKDWARDGISYVERNPDADVLDFPNNIFAYMKKDPMPPMVRELVEGIYLQGIRKGNGMAACNLGALYYTGQIGEQSYQKAMELYEFAADTGDVQAIENLGYCYYYGRNCEVDYQKAYNCFAKGAFQGRIISLYKIGDMYKNGYYLTEDPAAAFNIYSRCIDMINADPESTKNSAADVYVRYAECYLYGIGCDLDTLKALFWAQRAEYEFRVKEDAGEPFAREGIEWAVNLITECRHVLDGDIDMYQPS